MSTDPKKHFSKKDIYLSYIAYLSYIYMVLANRTVRLFNLKGFIVNKVCCHWGDDVPTFSRPSALWYQKVFGVGGWHTTIVCGLWLGDLGNKSNLVTIGKKKT